MNGSGSAVSTFDDASAHFLDTSAVIAMMRQRRVVGSGALLPFATVAELSIGGFRAADRAREWRRIELTLKPAAGVVYPTPRTLLIYAELSARMKAAAVHCCLSTTSGLPPSQSSGSCPCCTTTNISLWCPDCVRQVSKMKCGEPQVMAHWPAER